MTATTTASAIRLIELRADVARIGLSDETSRRLCAQIVESVCAKRELDALRDELLVLLSPAASELHTARGRLALWLGIAKIPDDESKPVEQRQAARLVLWRNLVETARDPERWSNDSPALDGQAVDEFNRVTNVINALDRARDTLIAIVDVWLSMLPELTIAEVDWLATLVPADQNQGS